MWKDLWLFCANTSSDIHDDSDSTQCDSDYNSTPNDSDFDSDSTPNDSDSSSTKLTPNDSDSGIEIVLLIPIPELESPQVCA